MPIVEADARDHCGAVPLEFIVKILFAEPAERKVVVLDELWYGIAPTVPPDIFVVTVADDAFPNNDGAVTEVAANVLKYPVAPVNVPLRYIVEPVNPPLVAIVPWPEIPPVLVSVFVAGIIKPPLAVINPVDIILPPTVKLPFVLIAPLISIGYWGFVLPTPIFPTILIFEK